MPRQPRPNAVRELSSTIGAAANALRFTVNISQDVGGQLKEIAFENRVSESSVIEVALRQLFRRVTPAALGAFLRQNGACLRRRS
ncbi:MAG: hypothetical protein JO192_00090 [Candidatus Eremiobacteraeota bacterium]|nr:hypothetical protein [Candidatus Eremiobacteraeota bacterium]MBV8331113.1 hypothetical protein [Candidatus Eremiobacteraeota bacterium]MBV8722536.1 hypothetical protein [Candidatus Eremiobacteraeota bacterium]